MICIASVWHALSIALADICIHFIYFEDFELEFCSRVLVCINQYRSVILHFLRRKNAICFFIWPQIELLKIKLIGMGV
jgi:hypothetical protein